MKLLECELFETNFSLHSGPLRLAERWTPGWFAGPCL